MRTNLVIIPQNIFQLDQIKKDILQIMYKIEEILFNPSIGKGFLSIIQNSDAIKEKIDKFHFKKTKTTIAKKKPSTFQNKSSFKNRNITSKLEENTCYI